MKEYEQLLVQMIKTPDGTILESRHRHDYVTHKDKVSGEEYMVDGGIEYIRGNINKVAAEDMTCTTETPHEITRKRFNWGSYGINGDQDLHYIFLQDMDISHIEAILVTQVNYIHTKVAKLFRDELEWRENSNR